MKIEFRRYGKFGLIFLSLFFSEHSIVHWIIQYTWIAPLGEDFYKYSIRSTELQK